MVAVSLAFLCVFIFSAYAYGATTLLALRQMPVWGRGSVDSGVQKPVLDRATLALCLVCTVWFVLLTVLEFRVLIGRGGMEGVLGVVMFALSYAFPPLIMHTVLNDTNAACMAGDRRRRWAMPVRAMYVLSFGTCLYIVGAAFDVLPRLQPFGAWAGVSVGVLFTLCSLYCIALIARRGPTQPRDATPRHGLKRTMIGLFLMMIPLFFALTFLREQRLMIELLDRLTRTLPIFFLIASVYFENRFEFYDLIVKRAAMLMASLAIIGAFFAMTLSALDDLPAGIARPWLFAVAMVPIAMLLPWIHGRLGRWLDRMWFGREFTPVEAVKHVLSAMQPATDERMLVEAAEARLSEMFHTRVHLLLDGGLEPPGAAIETIAWISSESGPPIRVAVERPPESRPLLSEDLALLRSLTSVFGYMLENVRLQQRRQEQDQVAQELRLQTSRSELKALRAQINPHFLFNALNAIASLIHTDPARADAAVEQLAEVFRYTLRRSDQEWAPLDQELAFARAYLDVEQARFGRRLSFSIDASPLSADVQVPSMLLHTLVENAVKHGISQVRGAGRIDIRAGVDDGSLVIDVSDTGPGPNAAGGNTGGERFGLRSVRDRLRGYFGERASLELLRDDAQGVTRARIRMPLVNETSREGPFVREPA